MPKVSQSFIPSRTLKKLYLDFWVSLTITGDYQTTKGFFKGLLTKTEIFMLAKRIQIAKMLLKGYDYKTIESFLRIGSPTIAQVQDKLRSEPEFTNLLKELIKLETGKRKEKEAIKVKTSYDVLGKVLDTGLLKVDRALEQKRKRQSAKEQL